LLNPIFKSLSELNILLISQRISVSKLLKSAFLVFAHFFKRISKVIPSQASVLFFILFNFQGPCCHSRDSLYILPQLFNLVNNFFKVF